MAAKKRSKKTAKPSRKKPVESRTPAKRRASPKGAAPKGTGAIAASKKRAAAAAKRAAAKETKRRSLAAKKGWERRRAEAGFGGRVDEINRKLGKLLTKGSRAKKRPEFDFSKFTEDAEFFESPDGPESIEQAWRRIKKRSFDEVTDAEMGMYFGHTRLDGSFAKHYSSLRALQPERKLAILKRLEKAGGWMSEGFNEEARIIAEEFDVPLPEVFTLFAS